MLLFVCLLVCVFGVAIASLSCWPRLSSRLCKHQCQTSFQLMLATGFPCIVIVIVVTVVIVIVIAVIVIVIVVAIVCCLLAVIAYVA